MRLPVLRTLVGLVVVTSWIAGVVPPASGGVTTPAALIQIIDTSAFSPPSPDPSGLAFLPAGSLLMMDCEVEETPLYEGKNAFEITTEGDLVGTFRTTRFSIEPTGLEVTKKQLIVSDDIQDRVFFIKRGKDGRYGTKDDKVRSLGTRAFGARDPEGVALGGGFLFVAEGSKAEVFRLRPGPNGIFDGVAPKGDDRARQFDTESLGQLDPEGIVYRRSTGTLLLVSNRLNSDVTETTIEGEVVTTYDTTEFGLHSPSGLAWGPASTDPAVKHLWIADRGVDNVADPDENDGRIFEVAL